MNQQEIDIAVVGAGVVGLCCAYKLQSAGYKVVLFDRDKPGHGCSKGNAGHFATEQVLPLAAPGLIRQIPGMLLDSQGPVSIRWPYLPTIAPWFIRFLLNTRQQPFRAGAQALSPLNAQALGSWQKILREIGAHEQLKMDGAYLVFEDSQLFESYQKSTLLRINRYGVNTELRTGDEVREAEPALSKNIQHAVFFPDTGHTADPLLLSQTLLESFIRQGGLLVQDEVTGIRQRGDECELMTSTRKYKIPQLLLTTGAWSKALLKQATGVSIPLEAERGYHLMLPEAQSCIKVPISSADRKFIMTPMNMGLRLAGTVEFAGLNAPSDMRRAYMLNKHARELIDDLPAKTGDSWMGCRPSLPDSLPIIDRVGSAGQIFLALGHQHLGLTQAAITAEMILNLKRGESSVMPLNPYRLDRFKSF